MDRWPAYPVQFVNLWYGDGIPAPKLYSCSKQSGGV